MQFSQPLVLWLLALAIVPLLMTAFLSDYYRVYLSSKFQKSQSRRLVWIRTVLVCCVIAGLVLVSANPIRTQSIQNPLKNGIDILFVLDLSKSMLAEDIAPNRINAGKRVLGTFIKNRPNDRI